MAGLIACKREAQGIAIKSPHPRPLSRKARRQSREESVMARRGSGKQTEEPLPAAIADKVRPPVCVIAGPSGETTRLCAALGEGRIVCYEMDLYQAEQLSKALAEAGSSTTVATRPDLWD